jgi:hypothetical protein
MYTAGFAVHVALGITNAGEFMELRDWRSVEPYMFSVISGEERASKRRVFFAVGEQHYQLFSISQNQNDGSIYFSAPDFGEIDWLVPSIGVDQVPTLHSYNVDAPGKLSLHGSGLAHTRPYQSIGRDQFSIPGNALKSLDGGTLGVRHLLTIFLPEPLHRPESPAMARKSDYSFGAKERQPYIIVLWAVPASNGLIVNISNSFHVDDLEDAAKVGFGWFNMLTHAVVWFAYRTKNMSRWPCNAQACYHNGHTVPLFIGTGVGKLRLELRQPKLTLIANELTIETSH